jgi:hypothetical protein
MQKNVRSALGFYVINTHFFGDFPTGNKHLLELRSIWNDRKRTITHLNLGYKNRLYWYPKTCTK